MKLFYTPNSPYARVARVIALEIGLAMDFVQVEVRDTVDELLHYNPAAKVPTLELDDGVVLSDTRLICDYLQSRSDGRYLCDVDTVH